MLRQQGCVYLFEWSTPIVCSDATNSSGCMLTDSQLQYTFDLSTLTGEVQVSSVSVGPARQLLFGSVLIRSVSSQLRLRLCFRSQGSLASTTSTCADLWHSRPVRTAPSARCPGLVPRTRPYRLASVRP